MKYFLTHLLIQFTLTALGQVKTDTIKILQLFDGKIHKERNTYWSDKNEIGIIQKHRYNPGDIDSGYEVDLKLVFLEWNSIELNKEYNLRDLKNFNAECKLKEVFGGESFDIITGSIKLVSQTKDRLTFSFNIIASTKDESKCMLYKGERIFRPDY